MRVYTPESSRRPSGRVMILILFSFSCYASDDGSSYLKYDYFLIILNNNCINKYRCVFVGGRRVNMC